MILNDVRFFIFTCYQIHLTASFTAVYCKQNNFLYCSLLITEIKSNDTCAIVFCGTL